MKRFMELFVEHLQKFVKDCIPFAIYAFILTMPFNYYSERFQQIIMLMLEEHFAFLTLSFLFSALLAVAGLILIFGGSVVPNTIRYRFYEAMVLTPLNFIFTFLSAAFGISFGLAIVLGLQGFFKETMMFTIISTDLFLFTVAATIVSLYPTQEFFNFVKRSHAFAAGIVLIAASVFLFEVGFMHIANDRLNKTLSCKANTV